MSETVTIIVPTRNRSGLLSRCLDGIASQGLENNAQVIVVDNGDDDGATRDIVVRREDLKELVYIRTSPPGVSRARNAGLELARGAITVFIDDDEVPKDDWLAQLLAPFSLPHLNVDIVAGDYVPEWESPRPEWLADHYLGFYSTGIRWSDEPRLLQPSEWILEGNIAVRTELLRGAGGFDERLGRAEDSLVSCEAAVFDMLRKSGAVAYYNPQALVSHLIHADRLNKTWLLKRIFAQGVSKSILSETSGSGFPIPANVSVKLAALLAQDPNDLEGEELLILTQIFEILGFICHSKGVL